MAGSLLAIMGDHSFQKNLSKKACQQSAVIRVTIKKGEN
jgi:hypothetical protein